MFLQKNKNSEKNFSSVQHFYEEILKYVRHRHSIIRTLCLPKILGMFYNVNINNPLIISDYIDLFNNNINIQ